MNHEADGNVLQEEVDQSKLVNLGPIALKIYYRLTSSSGKQIGYFENAQIACLIKKILLNRKGSDDLSIGFHGSNEGRDQELTDI